MATAQRLIKELRGAFKDSGIEHPHVNFWFNELEDMVNEHIPVPATIRLGTVYLMQSKKGPARVIVTKENQKTWVMYEVEGSSRPGCRWMIYKTWCTAKNIVRDDAQSYVLPSHVVIK